MSFAGISTDSQEFAVAQKIAEDVLKLSASTYLRIYKSSRTLQSLSTSSLILRDASNLMDEFRLGACDTADNDGESTAAIHDVWADLINSTEISMATAIECITQFIYQWKLTKKWNFHIFPGQSSAELLQFDVIFSLMSLDQCHLLDICTVYFTIGPNRSATREHSNVITYRFETMSTEYPGDIGMFQFQEHILLTVIELKKRIKVLHFSHYHGGDFIPNADLFSNPKIAAE